MNCTPNENDLQSIIKFKNALVTVLLWHTAAVSDVSRSISYERGKLLGKAGDAVTRRSDLHKPLIRLLRQSHRSDGLNTPRDPH